MTSNMNNTKLNANHSEYVYMLQRFLSAVSSIEDTMLFHGPNMDGQLDWFMARDEMIGHFDVFAYQREDPELKDFGYDLMAIYEIAEHAGLADDFRQMRYEYEEV